MVDPSETIPLLSHGGEPKPSTSAPTESPKTVQSKLSALMENRALNSDILRWITENVPETTTKKAGFIEVLMEAFCSSAIKGEKHEARFMKDELISRKFLLQIFLSTDSQLQVVALDALQNVVKRNLYSPSVLMEITDMLIDENVIMQESFDKWTDNWSILRNKLNRR